MSSIENRIIVLDNFQGGFAPGYWTQDYPSVGSLDQAGAMTDADIVNKPGLLSQGLDATAWGTSATVTTQVKGITKNVDTSSNYYGVGGAKLYKFANSIVDSSTGWPHTIAGTSVAGEDVAIYNISSSVYVYYSHNNNTIGDVGRVDVGQTIFYDTFLSTIATGAFNMNKSYPHPMLQGPDNILYVGNGKDLVSINNSNTANSSALDLPTGFVITDVKWMSNRFYIAANNPNTDSQSNHARIFIWDGTSPSWEIDFGTIGRITALYEYNNVMYCWFIDSSNLSHFGYISGGQIIDIDMSNAQYSPDYSQVTQWRNHIVWRDSNGKFWAYGAIHPGLPKAISQFLTLAGGGIKIHTSTVVVSGTTGMYDWPGNFNTTSRYKTIMFPLTGTNGIQKSDIKDIGIFYRGANGQNIKTGASVDAYFEYETLTGAIASASIGTISLATSSAQGYRSFGFQKGEQAIAGRICFDWRNGSTSNPVNIKAVMIDRDLIDL